MFAEEEVRDSQKGIWLELSMLDGRMRLRIGAEVVDGLVRLKGFDKEVRGSNGDNYKLLFLLVIVPMLFVGQSAWAVLTFVAGMFVIFRNAQKEPEYSWLVVL